MARASSLAVLGASLLLSTFSLASAQSPPLQTLFAAYQTPAPNCYRQPIIVVADAQHLVAFAEGRTNPYCSGTADGSNSSIWVRTTADGGQTWTPGRQLYDGHPDYLSGVHDAVKGRTHLFIQTSPNLWTYSDDFGATWAPLAAPTVSIPAGYTATPGVAHGIQLSGDLCAEPTCNGLVGRLVVSWVCHGKGADESEEEVQARIRAHVRRGKTLPGGDVACPGCYSCLAVSDDNGASWKIDPRAVSAQDGSREASLAQLLTSSQSGAGTNPVVYASERNLGNVTGFRLHALSLDGGSSFASFGTDPGIPDSAVTNWTGIVAGVTRFDDAASGTRRVVLSTPSSHTARANMSFYTSTDETKTWSSGTLYRAGPAGYSDLGVLNSTHGVIIFEDGEDEFAQRISFGYFTAADL
jgi:hypothetical protein